MEFQFKNSILIFTDGACSGNPGPGGWGAVIALPHGEIIELGGGDDSTTNNRMEIGAAIAALRKIANQPGEVFLYTDSTYVIRGITQWVWGWMRNGWKNSQGEEVQNRDLWIELSRILGERKKADPNSGGKVHWKYSRGHVGTPGNERCDEIAVAFSKKKWIDLFQGSLLQYSIAIYDVPEDAPLPEMRPREEKKHAFSYLSVIGREVYRHKDWGSCERRVKGQSGAKFKKAMSANDEAEILKLWGFAADTKIKES